MEKWLSAHHLKLLLNHHLWINLAITVIATFIIYWLLRTSINFLSARFLRQKGSQHLRFYDVAGEMLRSTQPLLLLLFSLLLALKFIELPVMFHSAVAQGWFIVLMMQFALWLNTGIRLWLQHMLRDPAHVHNPVTTVISGILLRTVVWVMLLLAVLSNMGVDITALVASLGVGGIAVALALQTVLSDLFASLAIGFDKPFEQDDFIEFGSIAGSIEHIGLKTTRLRSLSGEQIVCSNTLLLQQTIHNYKRMAQRRVAFQFGINYGTPPAKLRQIGGIIKEIIQSQQQTRFDRAHFMAFAESQLTFEVVYYVNDADYNKYMDIQQEINLLLAERLLQMEVEFASPRRQLIFNGGQLSPAESAAGPTQMAP